MTSVLSRILTRFRRNGVGRTLKYIVFVVFLERCGLVVNNEFILHSAAVDDEPAKLPGFIPETLTGMDQLSELDVAYLRNYGEEDGFVRRFARGQTCLIVRADNGELASVCWYGQMKADENHRSGIISHCFTRSDYRGNGLYPWALRYIATTTTRPDTGEFSTLHIGCSAFNYSSAAGIRKAGFVLSETVITMGNCTLFKWSRVARRTGSAASI
ncbi:MAG: hypothetical protein HQ518_11980 [Rhodopirellula sp.]|nr:hypothetical protein [Rhodopirellula sp.]